MSTGTSTTPQESRLRNIDQPRIVTPDQWLAERKEFLTKEKAETRLRDQINAERRKLPWERVEKDYTFEGPQGKGKITDLFGEKSQLTIYHFMLGPGWGEGCPSCSMLADHFGGLLPHLNARDVSLAVVSRAPLNEIQAFKNRMGWEFNWVSSFGSEFNFDYHVSFTEPEKANGEVYYNYHNGVFPSEEAPGVSVFYRNNADEIFHTYSAFARGCDILLGVYNFLDLTPKGRDEDGLDFTMSWVRHHDRYDEKPAAVPIGIDKRPTVNLEPPRFENARAMFITGAINTYECGNANGIAKQWQEFAPRIGTISGKRGNATYGVVSGAGAKGQSFQYLCGVEVDDLAGIPEEFGGIRIPAQRYAVFNHRDHVSTIQNTIGAIFDKWLPESGYNSTNSPAFFERYGDEFDPVGLTGGLEIWLPIEA